MNINLSSIYNLFQNLYCKDIDKNITGVSIDTRTLKENDLFFAIKGDNFDGHCFVNKALSLNAAAAVCSKEDNYNGDVIYVNDTTEALQDFARYYRNMFDIPFISITGSNGKTTTKELINTAISTEMKTCYTIGNLNNQTGVPLTLFSLNENTQAAVIEMGMNSIGEIRKLSYIVKPKIAVITNIGTSHIGMLGSKENIFKAKTEVLDYIDNGYLVVNGDDDFLSSIKDSDNYKVIKVSIYNNDADYIAQNIVQNEDKTYSFTVNSKSINLSIPGFHNIYNALYAFAVSDLLEINLDKAVIAISECKNQKMRNQISVINGYTVINDAYNANYDSMKSSLELLGNYKKRKVAILGDMLELGDYEKHFHIKVGEIVTDNSIDVLIAIGKNADNYYQGAVDSGMKNTCIYRYASIVEAKNPIKDIICKDDIILLKGSRGSAMEKLIDLFEEEII